MNRAIRSILPLVILSFFASSCSTLPGISGKSSSDYIIEHQQDNGTVLVSAGSGIVITSAEAMVEGNELVIAGIMQRPHEVRFPGNVHLVILSPAGERLLDTERSIAGLSTRSKGMLNIPFRIGLGFLPPKGAIIRLQYLNR